MSFKPGEERERDEYCCLVSKASGEQLYGTATSVKTWLLLEYPYPWGAKAFEESILPGPVKDQLSAFLERFPESRLEFIKRSGTAFPDEITLFAVFADDGNSHFYEFQLSSYVSLLEMDFDQLSAYDNQYQKNRRHKPLFLVCTNGRRDFCCAKFGLPVFSEMSSKNEEAVWQCTHVGGHRFAANVISFPHGIYYGRVAVAEGVRLIETVRKGEILLERYRGRATYPEVAQAAEYFLRENTGSLNIDAYRLRSLQQVASNRWAVSFLTSSGQVEHRLVLTDKEPATIVYKNCKDTTASEVYQYSLESYEAVPVETQA